MLSEKLGHALDRPLSRLAQHIPFKPNTITVAGLALTIAASVVLAYDLFWGGILVLSGGLFDVMDGVVARVKGQQTQFGAFLDSVLDRYADSAIFGGLAAHSFKRGDVTAVMLCAIALIGSLLTSYVRARAEGLGKECKAGLIERPDRIALLVFGMLAGAVVPVLWALVVLSHLTVIQRILITKKNFTS